VHGRVLVWSTAAAALIVARSVVAAAEPPAPESNLCSESAGALALGSAQWNGWGREIENTRYQPEPALRANDVPKLGLKWAYGIQGSAVAGQPTVVDGRLFVMSAAGRVYSLDARSGCTYWTYDASAGTHSSIFIGELSTPRKVLVPSAPSKPKGKSSHGKKGKHTHQSFTPAHLDMIKAPSAAFFGDDSGAVYALDAQKGTLLWKTQIDSHPLARIVGTPTLFHDRLYVVVGSTEQSAAQQSTYACCTFRGSVAALDMTTGHLVWKTYAIAREPSAQAKTAAGVASFGPAGASIAGSATIDAQRDLLYVGTGGSLTAVNESMTDAVLALDLKDGQIRWAKQFGRHAAVGGADFASSPILRTLADGKQVVFAGQRSGIVYALDPDHGGEVLWQTKLLDGGVPRGIEWGPAADHRTLYVALSGLAAEPENASGALEAIDMKTGTRRWYTAGPTPACSWGPESCNHAQAQAVTVIPGIAFSGSMDGHLRAYSTIDGKIVWDTETAKDFVTVNGIKASGGSLDQGGATIVNGVVYINSGYGQRSGQPGNVLLAYSVDGK
jgi:polyvinyl alcohol dehydrogenase (cytochrome)